jgi:hypothetical protein
MLSHFSTYSSLYDKARKGSFEDCNVPYIFGRNIEICSFLGNTSVYWLNAGLVQTIIILKVIQLRDSIVNWSLSLGMCIFHDKSYLQNKAYYDERRKEVLQKLEEISLSKSRSQPVILMIYPQLD